MIALAALVVVAVATERFETADVPLAAGAWPAWPMTEAAFAVGPQACTARFEVASDGSTTSVVADGCAEPFLGATREAMAGVTVARGFARKHPAFEVNVVFASPPVQFAREREARLDDAVALPAPLDKYFDKKPFLPRGVAQGGCTVTLYVDPEGKPFAADLTACREDLRLAVGGAVLEWRYEPLVNGGVAAPAKFDVRVDVRR